MAQNTFKRIEIKYLLSEEQYNSLMKILEEYMEVDKYGLSKITSLYFDTEGYDIIRESLEKPQYKEKLRIRGYGEMNENSKVFLELKKKYKGTVYKRRIELTYKEAMDYLNDGVKPQTESQILNEIDYFINFYKPNKRTYIEYMRIALYGKEDRQFRITFDKDIKAKFDEQSLLGVTPDKVLLGEKEYLMEIKGALSMPNWLSSALSELKIYPGSFSKYGTACLNEYAE